MTFFTLCLVYQLVAFFPGHPVVSGPAIEASLFSGWSAPVSHSLAAIAPAAATSPQAESISSAPAIEKMTLAQTEAGAGSFLENLWQRIQAAISAFFGGGDTAEADISTAPEAPTETSETSPETSEVTSGDEASEEQPSGEMVAAEAAEPPQAEPSSDETAVAQPVPEALGPGSGEADDVAPASETEPEEPGSAVARSEMELPKNLVTTVGGEKEIVSYDEIPFAPVEQRRVISPDVARLHLASTFLLDRQPTLDASKFESDTGARFHSDGSVTLRVFVGNPYERLTVIGDFNDWGAVEDLSPYQLQPTVVRPDIHEVKLPPDDYHKAQYRLRDQNGNERLDLGSAVFSTPAFNERFYGGRQDDHLNSVFWKPHPIPQEALAPPVDLRGQQLVIAETDLVSLALKWTCPNPESRFYGEMGADNIIELYNFVGECGLADKLADMGYNAVQFMPLDTHVDFWEPGASYFPDWRYNYQVLSFHAKHGDFGSPDELRRMINEFHKSDVAVILDVIYSHYSNQGNNPPRDFEPLGYSQYHREDGWELYGGPWTKWGTRRFTYTPEVRENIVDAALVNVLDYGFDGLRLDNVNGIEAQPYGRQLLRELTRAIALYKPQSVVIGEGYFGDYYLNRALDVGGAGLLTTYSDRFYLWFTEEIIKYRDEVDTWRLDHMLYNDWPLGMLYYPGNHDEFANPGNPFQTRGRYLVEAIQGGVHNRKIQSWSALTLFASSYYLDMPQLWTLQPGNLNDNSPIDWPRLENPNVAEMAAFQSDMKQFFAEEVAFAPYNMHRHMLHWIDHDNKVVVFERIDFATGKRVYVVVNLGDRAIDGYEIPIYPEDAQFALAIDSNRTPYGGDGRNPEAIRAANHKLKFFLDSYGVVGFVQQDKIEPVSLEPIDIEINRPRYDGYYPDAYPYYPYSALFN